jgi:hypothetical protein
MAFDVQKFEFTNNMSNRNILFPFASHVTCGLYGEYKPELWIFCPNFKTEKQVYIYLKMPKCATLLFLLKKKRRLGKYISSGVKLKLAAHEKRTKTPDNPFLSQ